VSQSETSSGWRNGRAAVSNGYARGKFGPVPRDAKGLVRLSRGEAMPGITYSLRWPSMLLTAASLLGEPIECPSPAAAIERAQGLWKVLGHTGAVAFSRTGDPATGDFSDAKIH